MPYTHNFYPEHHLLYEHVFGVLSLEEVHDLHQITIETLTQVETPIDLLVDCRALKRFPMSLSRIKEVMAPIDSTKLRWMIFVTNGNPMLKFMTSMVVQIVMRARLRIFSNLEEASAFLEETESTPDLHYLLLEIEKRELLSA